MTKHGFSKQNGFSLIEILVVIGIIGILASLLVPNLIGVRQRARDSQRKSDIRQIQSALELYRADNASYPSQTGPNYWLNSTACLTSNAFISPNLLVTYMQKIPCDPTGTGVYNAGNYYYYSNQKTYTLAGCLENSADSSGTSATPSASISPACASGRYYVVNNQ